MATINTFFYKPNKNDVVKVALQLSHKGSRLLNVVGSVPACKVVNGTITDKKMLSKLLIAKATAEAKMEDLTSTIDTLTAQQIYDYIFSVADYKVVKDVKPTSLDYMEYYRSHIIKLKNRKGRTWESYQCSYNNLRKFVGKDSLDINEVTKMFLQKYMKWMQASGTGDRAREMYMVNHKAVHNAAKKEFNDEDEGIVVVKYSPFDKVEYHRSKVERQTEHRAYDADTMWMIYTMPYTGSWRADMAKDVFLMSFCLCGMNAVDMFELKSIKDDKIDYHRAKVVARSGEMSRIVIDIPEFLKPIEQKYRAQYKRHAWMFAERYSSVNTFDAALNKGLKEMAKAFLSYYAEEYEATEEAIKRITGIDETITFYSARHSFATIAANDCDVPMDIVDRCLCHVSNSIALNTYVKQDYAFVGRVIDKVLRKTFYDDEEL